MPKITTAATTTTSATTGPPGRSKSPHRQHNKKRPKSPQHPKSPPFVRPEGPPVYLGGRPNLNYSVRKRSAPAPDPDPSKRRRPQFSAAVHRVRHLRHRPSPIAALAAHPAGGAFALSHGSVGDVELYALDTPEMARRVVGIPGSWRRSVDGLAWAEDGDGTTDDFWEKTGNGSANEDGDGDGDDDDDDTSSSSSSEDDEIPEKTTLDEKDAEKKRYSLYGSSRDGTLFLLDTRTQSHRRVTPTGGGAVLSFLSRRTVLLVGGEDGALRFFSTILPDAAVASPSLRRLRSVPLAGGSVLSLVWPEDPLVWAGCADGTLRSLRRNHGGDWTQSLRLTLDSFGSTVPTKPWALVCPAKHPDVILAGDSTGHVSAWDVRTGTPLGNPIGQNSSGALATSSSGVGASEATADVTCLASDAAGNVYASGIDARVLQLVRGDDGTWHAGRAKRTHVGDMGALCVMRAGGEGRGREEEAVISGGADTQLISCRTQNFGREGETRGGKPRRLVGGGGLATGLVTGGGRVLAMCRRVIEGNMEQQVDLYLLPHKPSSSQPKDKEPARIEEGQPAGIIQCKSPLNITCSALSNDGKILCLADVACLTIFILVQNEHDAIVPTPIAAEAWNDTPPHRDLAQISTLKILHVEGSYQIYCGRPGAVVVLSLDLDRDDAAPALRLTQRLPLPDDASPFPVALLDVSPAGDVLAAAAGSLSPPAAATHLFRRSAADDPFVHFWSVPRTTVPPSCLALLPPGEETPLRLAVAGADNGIQIYDVEARALAEWSRKTEALPAELTTRNEGILRIVPDPRAPHKFLLGGYGFFCTVDLDRPVPQSAEFFPHDHVRAVAVRKAMKMRGRHIQGYQAAQATAADRDKRDGTAGTDREEEGRGNFVVCLCFDSMLYLGNVGEGEMVAIERPWTKLREDLPDSLARKLYGR